MLDVIRERRSVRAYTDDKIDRDTIGDLLAAAVRAPTAVHQEPWAFVIVQDRVRLRSLSDRAKVLFLEEARRTHLDRGGHALDIFEQPDFNIFYNAGTLIVICGASSGSFMAADCWLAAENLLLAACAMGLGTCVIGAAVTGLNTPGIKAELGIPAGMSAVVPIIVGVPDDEGAPTTRQAPRVLAWL